MDMKNKITRDGITMQLWEWLQEFKLPPSTFRQRVKGGWSIDEALIIPPGLPRRKK